MKQPTNYVKGGPTYQDQMYDAFCTFYNPEDPNIPDNWDEIWDNCMMCCEAVHLERIRNILSPIVNLIAIVKNKETRDMIDDIDIIRTCENSINRLLNLPQQ